MQLLHSLSILQPFLRTKIRERKLRERAAPMVSEVNCIVPSNFHFIITLYFLLNNNVGILIYSSWLYLLTGTKNMERSSRTKKSSSNI